MLLRKKSVKFGNTASFKVSLSTPVVVNLGLIETLGFDRAISGVWQRSSELQNSANVFDHILLITTIYIKIEQSSASWISATLTRP